MSDALGSEVWMYAGLRSELNHIVFLFFEAWPLFRVSVDLVLLFFICFL